MDLKKVEENAALTIHYRAHEEAEKYAQSCCPSIFAKVAYGRGYKAGYMCGAKEFTEKAINWLRDRVNIPYDVETNEDGEPLAGSYIDYAKKRLEVTNEIIDEFLKFMGE